jgi:hypothetical protein
MCALRATRWWPDAVARDSARHVPGARLEPYLARRGDHAAHASAASIVAEAVRVPGGSR